MSIDSTNPNYPVNSSNPFADSFDFWHDFGFPIEHPSQVRELSKGLKTAPSDSYRDSVGRKVGKTNQVHSGVISDEAANKLLGGPVPEGSQIHVGVIEENSYPSEVYEVELRVLESLKIDEQLEEEFNQGALLIEEASNSPSPGRYDLIPVGYRAEYSDTGIERDLTEMR